MGKMIASSSSVLCFGRSFLSSRTKQLGVEQFYFWLFAIKFYDAQVTENRGSWWLIKAKEIQWQLFSKVELSIRSQHLINKLSLQPSLQPKDFNLLCSQGPRLWHSDSVVAHSLACSELLLPRFNAELQNHRNQMRLCLFGSFRYKLNGTQPK